MLSVKFILRKDKINKLGEAPIYLILIENRVKYKASIKKSIQPKQWNDNATVVKKNWIRSGVRSTQLNAYLFNLYMRIEELISNNSSISAKEIIHELKGIKDVKNTDFLNFIEEQMQDYKGVSTQKKYKYLKKHLQDCFKSVEFKDLNHSFLIRFERYLITQKRLETNSVATNFNALKAMYRKARVLNLCEIGLFENYKIKTERTQKNKLSTPELNKLISANLDEHKELLEARNAFLFAYYCQGIRVGDMVSLKFSNIQNGYINYVMGKTGFAKSIKIHEKLNALIQIYTQDQDQTDYILPYRKKERRPHKGKQTAEQIEYTRRSTATNKYNASLKKLEEHLNLDKHLSSHIARHTFADLARQKTGDVYTISKALGHSNIATTQTYLNSFDQESVDKLSDDLFDD